MPRAPKLLTGLLLALALASPSGALGQRYVITDFGAVPGSAADPVANARAIQRALDTAAADFRNPNGAGPEVYVPAHPDGWHVGYPLWLDRGVGLRGEPGAKLWMRNGATILTGFKRPPTDPPLVDLSNVLDLPITQPKRFGVPLATHWIVLRGSPFDLGPAAPNPRPGSSWYDDTEALTLEWCFAKGPAYNDAEPIRLFGSRWFNGPVPTPFWLDVQRGRYTLSATLRDGSVTRFSWQADLNPVQRGRLVIDLATARAQAYRADGACSVTIVASPGWRPGCRLARPRLGEFSVPCVNGGDSTKPDVVITGLKFTDLARYPIGVPDGTPPVRNDGRPTNDLTSFVQGTSGDFAVLALPTAPSHLAGWSSFPRSNTNAHGPAPIQPRTWNPFDSTPPVAVRSLSIEQGGAKGFGSAITIGLALDLRLEDLQFRGFARAIDQVVWNTSYTTRIDRCRFLTQSDCGISLDMGIFTMHDLFFLLDGRTPIRLTGSSGAIRDVLIGDTGIEAALEAYRVEDLTLENWSVDIERPSNKLPAAFLVSRGGYSGSSVVRLTDVNSSGTAPNGVFLRTTTRTEGPWRDVPGQVVIDGSFDQFVPRTAPGIVRNDDGWRVEQRGTAINSGNPGQPPMVAPVVPTVPTPTPTPAGVP